LYDFKSAGVNNFRSFFIFIFPAAVDTKLKKIARLLMKAEFFRLFKGYTKRAARVLR
jgi:hypothetical protein